jgi:hypothetical protein
MFWAGFLIGVFVGYIGTILYVSYRVKRNISSKG